MFSSQAMEWSDRCYRTLLSLYPVEFRIRFGEEMAQTFQDCCRDAMRPGNGPGLFRLWLKTLRDLALSIPREQVRVLQREGELTLRAADLARSIAILILISLYLPILFIFAFSIGAGLCLYLGTSMNLPGPYVDLAVLLGGALTCLFTLVAYYEILVWSRSVRAHRTPRAPLGLEVPNASRPAVRP